MNQQPIPIDYKYSKDHTWVKLLDENQALIGVTEFAQRKLEIVYIALPSIGKLIKKNELFGTIEAVKTIVDLFMPVGGNIIDINSALLPWSVSR